MVVVIVPHRNTVQEEELMKQATQPSVSAQEIKLILILNVPQKISQTDINQSIHPYTLPVSHTYTIHPSIHPPIYPSDLPQKLYLKFTLSILSSIHPYIWLTTTLSLTYTNPSIHPSCISNLHYPSIDTSIHLTYHKHYLWLRPIHPSIHPSCISNLHYPFIHTSGVIQTLSLTYTNPSIHPSCISNLHFPSIHPSDHSSIWLTKNLSQTYTIVPSVHPFIHPSKHLTYHKHYL